MMHKKKPIITKDELQDHVDKIAVATTEDLDELLHDLMVMAWPMRDAQDN